MEDLEIKKQKRLAEWFKKIWTAVKGFFTKITQYLRPISAIVIRTGGATIWGDDKLTIRVRLIRKDSPVTIYERRGNAVRIHPTKEEWMNIVTLEINPERKPNQRPISAIVIRTGGATIWGDDKLTIRGRLIPKDTRVVIYEIRGNSARVHPKKEEWMNMIAISEVEVEKK